MMSDHNEEREISAFSVARGMWMFFRAKPIWTLLLILESIIYRLFMLVGDILGFVLVKAHRVLKIVTIYTLAIICALLPGNTGLRLARRIDQLLWHRACKKDDVLSNRELYETAIHEAGHAVVALNSPSLRYCIEEAVVYRRAKKCSDVAVWRTGHLKVDLPSSFLKMTKSEVIEQLSMLYAGALANRRFTPSREKVGDGMDREQAYTVSICYGFVNAGGPIRGQVYGIYLRAVAKQRAQKILERERGTVMAVAKRLRATPNKAISGWDLLMVDHCNSSVRRK